MIKSMTGYGKAVCELSDMRIVIEARSLNSKQLDVFLRLPSAYREKEIEIRRLAADVLNRGKVELNVSVESLGQASRSSINPSVFSAYLAQIKTISEQTGIPLPEDYFHLILRLPEVMKTEEKVVDESSWEAVHSTVKEALHQLDDFRAREGAAMYADVSGRVKAIEHLLAQVAPFEQERMEKVRGRIKDALTALDAAPDMERLEQEMIFYIEKMDINEEKMRLKHHCQYFMETAALDEPQGKKLGFISQEMGREINTLGSKANHEAIQKIVVQMKDELEKIKEQVLNVL